MSFLSGYMFELGDYVFTGGPGLDSGVIILIREGLGKGKALVCENYFAPIILELTGCSIADLRQQDGCKCQWFDMASLMPDDDQDAADDEFTEMSE